MTYNPNTPQSFDVPSDNQDEFLTNFSTLNDQYSFDHFPFGHRIESATRANPCRLTVRNHGLSSGDQITLNNLLGNTVNVLGNYKPWPINGNTYAITVANANAFTIPVDSSSFKPYVQNTGSFLIASLASGLPVPYGYHKKISFNSTRSAAPDLVNPASSIYTKTIKFKKVKNRMTQDLDLSNPFFQNDAGAAFEFPLSGVEFAQKTYTPLPLQGLAYGFKSGFDLIFNFGYILSSPVGNTYELPVAYTTTHYSTVAFGYQPNLNIFRNVRITATTLTNFTISNTTGNPPGINCYFLSIGR